MRGSATTKIRHIILDFDMVSEIITFEDKGRFGKEKHQNLGVKVKVVTDMVNGIHPNEIGHKKIFERIKEEI